MKSCRVATTRATNVLRFLQEVEGLPGARLSAAGYADTRPRASNDDPQGRAENRRVEIVILIQPYLEDLVPADVDTSEVENPAFEGIVPPNLLDLSPEPVEPEPVG